MTLELPTPAVKDSLVRTSKQLLESDNKFFEPELEFSIYVNTLCHVFKWANDAARKMMPN
jgi:hypothetical protein